MKCRLFLLVGALIAPVLSFADIKYTFDFSFPSLWPQVTMSYTAPSSTAPGANGFNVAQSPLSAAGFPVGRSRGSGGAWTFSEDDGGHGSYGFTAQTNLTFPNVPGAYPNIPASVTHQCAGFAPGCTTQTVAGTVKITIALTGNVAASAPYITPRGVVNAASFAPPGAPNGSIAQGSIFSIFGANFGPAGGLQVSAFPLSTTLGGVSVRVFNGSTSVDAYPLYVNQTQINVIMPSNVPLGAVSLQVTAGGLTSNVASARVTPNAPGIFSVLGSGYGPGVIQNYVGATSTSPSTTPINSTQAAAAPGQVEILWATGLGPIAGPDNISPPVGSLPVNLKILVGGQPAAPQYGGRSPGNAALDQITFAVPANAPSGCFVPVELSVNGALSNVVTMAIQPGGGPCSEPGNPVATALVKGGKNGNIGLMRRTVDFTDPVKGTVTIDLDYLTASFNNEPSGNPFAFGRLVSLPPAGTCSAFTARGDLTLPSSTPPPPGPNLDAGDLVLSGPKGSKTVPNSSGYSAILNGAPGSLIPDPTQLFLDPGNYQISAAGGADIGGFLQSFSASTPPVWSNRTLVSKVDRSTGLSLNWTGAGTVLIVGSSYDLPTDSSGLFVCRAVTGGLSFTVPPEILGLLPPARVNRALTQGYLMFVGVPSGFPATVANSSKFGLDFASISYTLVTGQVVAFQ